MSTERIYSQDQITKLRCAAQLRHYGNEYVIYFPDWVFAHCGLESPNWDTPEKYYGMTFREYWEN